MSAGSQAWNFRERMGTAGHGKCPVTCMSCCTIWSKCFWKLLVAATRGFSSSFMVPGNLARRLVLWRGQDK